jgi:hypothetical protein
MTGAVRCVVTEAKIDFAGAVPEGGRKAGLRGWRQNDLAVDATKNDLTRAKRADGPQGTEANGDELMASEPVEGLGWIVGVCDCEQCGCWGLC